MILFLRVVPAGWFKLYAQLHIRYFIMFVPNFVLPHDLPLRYVHLCAETDPMKDILLSTTDHDCMRKAPHSWMCPQCISSISHLITTKPTMNSWVWIVLHNNELLISDLIYNPLDSNAEEALNLIIILTVNLVRISTLNRICFLVTHVIIIWRKFEWTIVLAYRQASAIFVCVILTYIINAGWFRALSSTFVITTTT